MEQSRTPRRFASRARPRLVLGGLAAAAGMSLSGCGGTPDFQPAEFTSVRECTSAGFPQEVCEAGYNSAFLEHQKAAPRFASKDSCEKEWGTGQCAPPLAAPDQPVAAATAAGSGSSFGNVFVPALAGFVVSQALQQRYYNNGDVGIGYYGGYGGYRGTPIYRNRGGSTVTLDRSGGTTVARPVNVNTRSVATRGFGGMSMSRGSFGG